MLLLAPCLATKWNMEISPRLPLPPCEAVRSTSDTSVMPPPRDGLKLCCRTEDATDSFMTECGAGGAGSRMPARTATPPAARPDWRAPDTRPLHQDKSTLKVYLPNGGFNVVKFGDATDIKVRDGETG